MWILKQWNILKYADKTFEYPIIFYSTQLYWYYNWNMQNAILHSVRNYNLFKTDVQLWHTVSIMNGINGHGLMLTGVTD